MTLKCSSIKICMTPTGPFFNKNRNNRIQIGHKKTIFLPLYIHLTPKSLKNQYDCFQFCILIPKKIG